MRERVILRTDDGLVLMRAPISQPLFWAPEDGGVPFVFPSRESAQQYAWKANHNAHPVVQELVECSE